MLEGLVAAGFYSCFYGNRRRAALVGIGAAILALGALWLSGLQGCREGALQFFGFRSAVPVLTALWLMLMGFLFQEKREGQKEQMLLLGGGWLLARSLGGLCAGSMVRQVEVLTSELRQLESSWMEVQQTDFLQMVIATALFAMGVLYLLGRERWYPLWAAVLAALWLLTGFLGSIAYAELWQQRAMVLSLYLVVGGILVFQQIYCIRQELERAKWEAGAGMLVWEHGSDCGEMGSWLRTETQNKTAETGRRDIRRQSQSETDGRKAKGILRNSPYSSSTGSLRESAEREYQRLQIFEHDFRHHLDVVAALYEEGNAAEARDYMEDIKQARVSRQGLKSGGERELSYIMMAKKEACRQARISFSYQIVGSPRGIAQIDMTALLLNLLDNAIRACRNMPEPRSISVMLLSRGELWEIEMTNSGQYEPQKSAVEIGSEAGRQTRGEAEVGIEIDTKTGTSAYSGMRTNDGIQVCPILETGMEAGRKIHGIGMVSVRQIVDKYQGTYRIWQEDGQVRQKLILVQRGE